MINQKKLDLQKAFDILLNWKTVDPEKIENFVGDFYRWKLIRNRKMVSSRREDPIFPSLMFIDNHQELLDLLLSEFGQEGVEDLIVYLLEHDNRYENTDTIENYKTYKPYPSYFVQFAYLLIFILPKGFRTRRLFEVFWEHQARVRPGIDVDVAKQYLDPFIEEKVITIKDIQDLLIRDWWRWQEAPADSLYYGASIGPSTWYVENYQWSDVVKKLEEMWKKDTGKEPKKWGE